MPTLKSCKICKHIPDHLEVETLHTDARLPPSVQKLVSIGFIPRLNNQIKKCQLCGTYYRYSHDHDSESGTGHGYTDESITRLTRDEAIENLKDMMLSLWPYEKKIIKTELDFLANDQPKLTSHQIKEAMDDLLQGDSKRQKNAAWNLARLQDKAVMAAPVLAKVFLNENENDSRDAVAHALSAIGSKGFTPLIQGLKSRNDAIISTAALAVGKTTPPATGAIPALTRILKNKSGHVRACAAWALGKMGAKAKSTIPQLIQAMHKDSINTDAYKWALSKMGKAAVTALTRAIRDEKNSWSLRWHAIEILGEMGPSARSSVPALKRAIGDQCPVNSVIRRQAVEALVKIGHPIPKIVLALRKALKHSLEPVRVDALGSLKDLGQRV